MDKQPEALRLAEILDNYAHGDDFQRPVEAARRELIRLHKEVESFNSILDQAFKDQTDAERYMHLKNLLKFQNGIEAFAYKSSKEIDEYMDQLIRSYD